MWLFTKNIDIDKLFKKLDHKMMNLLDIIGKKNILLKLQLYQAIKIHHVFHPNFLQKTFTDLLTGQIY